MIASSLSPVRLLAMMVSFFQSPISETLGSYLISLTISMLKLLLFQVVRVGDPVNQWVSYITVLGLPSTKRYA